MTGVFFVGLGIILVTLVECVIGIAGGWAWTGAVEPMMIEAAFVQILTGFVISWVGLIFGD
jgi:hypothetical protein